MSATVLFVALALGQVQADKPVTDAEKKDFLELLAKLPHKGEFFTEEAIAKAAPYTRVLLALTEKDLGNRDIYPFAALSRGLLERKEPRQYGLSHFNQIAHPKLKLFWAAVLFRDKSPSPEIVAFLRKALDSKETARTLREIAGPEFKDFKEQVILASERSKLARVEFVKKREINAFPDTQTRRFCPVFGPQEPGKQAKHAPESDSITGLVYEYKSGSGSDYTDKSMIFAPGQFLCAVHPHKQQGELIAYDLEKGTTKRLAIPQPKGFKAKYDFSSYFDDPILSTNSSGDLFCRWNIEGNGDHGLALLQKGGDSFTVKRIKLYLAYNSHVLADRDGTWYLLQFNPSATVYRANRDLSLNHLGQGHHIGLDSARFIANGFLHLFWGGVVGKGNHVQLSCADFDVTRKKFFHNREIIRFDQSVDSISRSTVLQLADESLHYLWGIDGGEKNSAATGLYYQAEAHGGMVKVAGGYDYRAIAVGNRIIVCYTLEKSPDKAFFGVINHGVLGPVSEITIAKGEEHNLQSEYMLLYFESSRIWFLNTLTRNTLYELRLVDAKKP